VTQLTPEWYEAQWAEDQAFKDACNAATSTCDLFGHNTYPQRMITSSGIAHVHLFCRRCTYRTGARKHADYTPEQIASMPIYRVNTCWSCKGAGCQHCTCAHCGSQDGTELHHWAPRHLFDDSDRWPTSPLCRDCHRLWHATVTPNMAKRKAA